MLDVPFGGSTHRILAPGQHITTPPPTIYAVEFIGMNCVHNLRDLLRRHGNKIGIACHEADVSAVRHNGDAVAYKQRPTALGAVGPVQYGAAVEMSATLNERYSGD